MKVSRLEKLGGAVLCLVLLCVFMFGGEGEDRQRPARSILAPSEPLKPLCAPPTDADLSETYAANQELNEAVAYINKLQNPLDCSRLV
jgi:hypothetical protein